jgi:hypothetical protein
MGKSDCEYFPIFVPKTLFLRDKHQLMHAKENEACGNHTKFCIVAA